MKESSEEKKRQLLRNNEYYGMQELFDELYNKASKGYKFTNLVELIKDENNIKLAYRNIKNNGGADTKGTDGKVMSDYEDLDMTKYINLIQAKLTNYQPKSVRRSEIPKEGGKKRPLGIPCMIDRIIQQCIKQILEPICEAKFHKHSYGFRPNRSVAHAKARAMALININKNYYVVDIDIKGFFDNVNHAKLKRQLWNLGICDKNLISIIGKILKSEIKEIGIPQKGTPQGGIISPLLSNVVLNELDWWISSQWENMKTRRDYKYSQTYKWLRKNSNLKEMWLVRYADDFKIFCKDYKTAQKIYKSTRDWLKERLDLDISPEKSKITNLKKNYTEFLGFRMMAKPKKNKFVCQSRLTEKAIRQVRKNITDQIKEIQRNITPKGIFKLNSKIRGIQNYYKLATWVTVDLHKIKFLVNRTLNNRLRRHITNRMTNEKLFRKLYGNYTGRVRCFNGIPIFPIHFIKTAPPRAFNPKINNYTSEGRTIIHKNLCDSYSNLISYYIYNYDSNYSVKYNDNRISLIAGQRGKCYITGEKLEIGNMECHHKIPKHKGGTNDYNNLVWITKGIHKIIHLVKDETMEKYKFTISNLDNKGLERLNNLRELVGNSII